jgi:dihydroflavonol-4-reductase
MILVTGSSGHIGNVLVRELTRIGERVLIMTKSGTKPQWLEDLDIEVCQGDLTDQSSIERAVAKSKIVFHLAGIISISSFDSKELRDTNVIGTKFIVDACLKYKVERLIYTSSVHALREAENGQAIKEQKSFDSKKLFGAYARTKAEATQIVLNAVKLGLNAVICFPSGVMGPYDFRGSEAGRLIIDYSTNKLPVYINGAYNFVDVRDVVKGLLLAKDKGRSGEGYVIAGEKMTLHQLFDTLSDLVPTMKKPRFKMPVSIAIGSAWILEGICKIIHVKPMFTVYAIKVLQSNCNISSQKAITELGYSYRSMKECIKDSLVWLKENNKI